MLEPMTNIAAHYAIGGIGLDQGRLTGGRLITVDLLIKVACFVKKIYNINISLSKLDSTRRSTVLSLPVQ